jgi:superfamily II DNA/RNA helicase
MSVPSLPQIIDNATTSVEEVYGDIIPEAEEVRIATGYFYLSGFDLHKDDLENLRDPDEMGHAPLRILMGRQTNQPTATEVEEGQTIRDEFKEELRKDINDLNNAQLGRLDRLRDFIAQGLANVRVRNPDQGYFHAKGATFRFKPDDPSWRNGEDRRLAATIVGSSNFSQSGQRHNVELNLSSQNREDAEAFETWYDNQWANSSEFSDEVVNIIENSDQYQEWQEQQEAEDEDDEETEAELGTFIEPFEMYKLLAYDELRGNVGTRDSPLYYFQSLGYESADEKLSRYNGCIISDSVGLGKSFIGSELLYDYRSIGETCLLIVPANLTNQWRDLLQDATDEEGNLYFGLEVDGNHLDVMSISKFQNLSYDRIQELRDQFDVLLIDEAHRFRNFGKWRPNPDNDDDYKGTRRHANLRQFRGHKMVMLTATPINNSATDLKNLISLFSSAEELQNKASLNFNAFDSYIDTATERKKIAKGAEEATEAEQEQLTKQLSEYANQISEILNEVMVLRTRNHVKELVQDNEDFDMRFQPPTLNKEEYTLPDVYQPIYQMLPDVMDALHLPHITIKNPRAGSTLKALYKLNLLKRLESSTYAFVQSIQTLHQSERALLDFLDDLPEDEKIDLLRAVQDDEQATTLADFVEGEAAVADLEDTLEEFGFDTGTVKSEDGDESPDELIDVTVGEVKTYIQEDLTLLAYFLSQFIGRVALDSGDVGSNEYEVSQWLATHGAAVLPDVPDDEINPVLYPRHDLSGADSATRDYYESVFALREFRDPKIDRMTEVLGQYDQKVLIFTQYRATADYVHRTLVENPESPLTEENSAVVKGGDDNKQAIIKRFAPNASGYKKTLAENNETELQYVVATDTLSEGVNLQDISVVVNYDLPWNPMRIVQRVGRIDRIGSTDEKYVHNFYPDGDIEAAIKLLKRLQAKINDIALIVGKENNILDPNEDATLDKVGVNTERTIGEVQVEEVGKSIQASRDVDDYNELDDTSKNPLLRGAGSDENAAYQRYQLKRELNADFDLSADDFEYAEEFFETAVPDRERLYTRAEGYKNAPNSGVFGLAHMWFEDDNGEPEPATLGRVQRAFYYKPLNGGVDERPVLHLKMSPETAGKPIQEDAGVALSNREKIADHIESRLTKMREGQVGGAFEQGEEQSAEQATLLDFLEMHLMSNLGEEPCTHDEYDTIGEWATAIRDSLDRVRLSNTDEDRVLREQFRHNEKYDSLLDWPTEEFLGALNGFIDEYIDASPEYQETLVGESSINARLVFWGIIRR